MWHKIVEERVTPLVCLTRVHRLIKAMLVVRWF
jgi:hypothetical protein